MIKIENVSLDIYGSSRIFVIDDGKCFFNGTVDSAIENNIFSSIFKRDIEVFRRGERLYSSLS